MSIESMFRLDGQVAIVTGAGSGLGAAIAPALADAGAAVVCCDIELEGARRTAASIVTAGGTSLAVRVDVAAEDEVSAMVELAVRQFGQLDVIFNNAGIGGESCLAHELPAESWSRTLSVDLNGVFFGARDAARVMMPRRKGKIVNTASVWGYLGSGHRPFPAYCAAKGAVTNLTRELALEYAPFNIQVNAMAPLGFATNLNGGVTFSDPVLHERMRSQIPLGHTALPADIQGLALLLASRASDYMTGAIIPIDGGFSAK